MNIKIVHVRCLGSAVFAVLLTAAGCASNSPEAVSYEAGLERAAASIRAAEQAGAYEHGSAELNLAREKLNEARAAAEAGAYERAMRLAVEADLDADLAVAIAGNQEIQIAVRELEDSNATLQDEVRRNARPAPGEL
jgi:Domain of unknown function (DUF4398)